MLNTLWKKIKKDLETPRQRGARRRVRKGERGMTLVEIMVVVVIIMHMTWCS